MWQNPTEQDFLHVTCEIARSSLFMPIYSIHKTTGISIASNLSVAYRYTQSHPQIIKGKVQHLWKLLDWGTALTHILHIFKSKATAAAPAHRCKDCLQTWRVSSSSSPITLTWSKPFCFLWLDSQKEVLHGWGNASRVCLFYPEDPRITGMKGATWKAE